MAWMGRNADIKDGDSVNLSPQMLYSVAYRILRVLQNGIQSTNYSELGQKIPESPWGSSIPIGYGDGDVNRFPDGDRDGDGDEAEKRGWGCTKKLDTDTENGSSQGHKVPKVKKVESEKWRRLLLHQIMTKDIKGEFEKIKDVKVEDVPLTCDASLEVFNNEVSRLSRMDDDLFTYEVEVANIPCDLKMDNDLKQEADEDMGYDPSDIAIIEWLGSKIFNYKTMDHYTMKALWIYEIRGDDEVKLTDDESSDNMDEVAEVFRINTNLFDFETPMCKAFNEFNYLLQIDPDLLTKDIEGFKTYEDYKND
ncbi:hypothetical protein Tco_0003674 [Tanacetum coccineum]